MSTRGETAEAAESLAEKSQQFTELAERRQRIVAAVWERQMASPEGHEFQLIDPIGVARAFGELTASLMADPVRLVEAQSELMRQNLALWEAATKRFKGEEVDPLYEPERGDRRFKDPHWAQDATFDYMKQSYLLASRWLQGLVHDAEGLDPKAKDKVEFYTRQFISATSPSNFAFTNPQVIERTRKTHGENLIKGLEHLLADLEKGRGRVKISMTDESAFEVGRNVATTPGKVIYQNELMQLIQYSPSTEKVFKRPLLFVPPWINKFYVMDLQPKNSLIKWTVDQGHTLFVVSWTNHTTELAHKSFEDYMLEGPIAALDAIEKATGETSVNILGFCIGGILTVALLAYLAAKGEKRVESATFLATMVDLREVGEVSVFVDEEQVRNIERYTEEKGYLEGHHMMDMFSMMRENDLIWSFVVNNYLMGREPMPFDLLYWNADSTRLPAEMLVYYLRKFYLENGLTKPGHIELDGVPIDLGKVKTPAYFLATKEDHIAPWSSCYPATQLLTGPVRFILGGSGHIAGVINPPAANKYGYWSNEDLPPESETWLANAEFCEGSWWPDWGAWLARHGGKKVAAREPGDGELDPIEDAPGSYVKVRASE
jgi:polyhydroxyalkanoate synthase